jgi:hypothetical protein
VSIAALQHNKVVAEPRKISAFTSLICVKGEFPQNLAEL